MSRFWENYPTIQNDLQGVLQIIEKTNKSSEPYLNESIDYLMVSGGKMIRPAFVLLGSQFGSKHNDEKDKLIHLAAAIETLHMASLVHDDIVDESKMRRGQESIQSKYGKPYAVYMGDYLFTQCFLMLSDYSFEAENIKRVAEAMKRVCVGEMLQYQRRYKVDKSTKNYLKVISGKTAALFAISLGVGAHESGAPEATSKLLGRIGYNIGMAFQIIDDLLDYKGDTVTFGKDTKADILKGYYTLPIIRSLSTEHSGAVEDLLSQISLSDRDISNLIEMTKLSGALRETEDLAQKYTQRALKYTDQLPECESKQILMKIIPKMLDRNR